MSEQSTKKGNVKGKPHFGSFGDGWEDAEVDMEVSDAKSLMSDLDERAKARAVAPKAQPVDQAALQTRITSFVRGVCGC